MQKMRQAAAHRGTEALWPPPDSQELARSPAKLGQKDTRVSELPGRKNGL